MDLNSAPSPYPLHQIYDIDHDHTLQLIPFGNSSSSSFFGSTHNHATMYDQGLSQQDYYQSDAYGDGYPSYEIKNKAGCCDFKLSLGKKFEDQVQENMLENENISTTPTSRMMPKIKNTTSSTPDRVSIKIVRSGNNKKIEDQKFQRRSYSPSSSSSDVFEPCNESPPHNNHMMMSPVRVCTDCNTTKTPLWRSGPKGPKSLCNACGIRQRKARRAMAAAAASGMAFNATKQPRSVKTKMHWKTKAAKSNAQSASSPLKKRFKNTVADHTGNSSGPLTSKDCQKKIGIEDFLMNFSNNLALHRVFPEDEKDAAILLMAISSGLVHG